MVELNHLFQKDRDKTASAARGTAELNRLFQKGQGKTASAARILSPNPTPRPLPCLLNQSFFYAHESVLVAHDCNSAIGGQGQSGCTWTVCQGSLTELRISIRTKLNDVDTHS